MPERTPVLAHASGRGPVLAIILAAYLMIVLDISIVITALPKIQAELRRRTRPIHDRVARDRARMLGPRASVPVQARARDLEILHVLRLA